MVTFSLLAGILFGLTPAPNLTDDYLCSDPKTRQNYESQRWFREDLPLKVYLPYPPDDLKLKKPQDYVLLVQKAFADWQQHAPVFGFQYVNQLEDANIDIVWREHFPVNEKVWGYASYPHLQRLKNNQVRRRSTINLAVYSQPGTGMTSQKAPFSLAKLQSIATHEVGHSLGLPHSTHPDDIMKPGRWSLHPEYQFKVTDRDMRTLKRLYLLPRKLKASPCS